MSPPISSATTPSSPFSSTDCRLITPVRILFVSHSFPPTDRPLSNVGGMQRVATDLFTALHEHDAVALRSSVLRSSWRWTHVKTVPFMASTLWKIYQMAERREIDAVLFSSMVTATLASPLRKHLRRHNVATAAIVHGRDVTLNIAPYQRFVPRVFSALDAVLPVSRATGEACLQRGLPGDKLFVVPNGVAVHRFNGASQTAARTELLERFAGSDLPDRGLLLCSVGRQVKRKGFAWFIRNVMPLLPHDVHYWLAGEGPEAENILAAARQKGLADRVRLVGRVSEHDLGMLYAGSDLFVMPNIPVVGDMEGFGVVMLEAGLSGLPTIGARLEGISDVIEEGKNGHLVRSGDAWGFSEAVMHYYREDARLQAASERAAYHVRSRYSWQAVADQYVDVLHQLRPALPTAEKAIA